MPSKKHLDEIIPHIMKKIYAYFYSILLFKHKHHKNYYIEIIYLYIQKIQRYIKDCRILYKSIA